MNTRQTPNQRDDLIKVHGMENCHICGKPKIEAGEMWCSYPHAMMPDKPVGGGMWTWK